MADEESGGIAGVAAVLDTQGQIAVPLDGQDFVLRPSYEAIRNIERQLARSLFDLAMAASQGGLAIDDQAIIVNEMMRAHGKTISDDDPLATTYRSSNTTRIADLIYEAGAPRVSARLVVLLTGALNGGYAASGEAKAGTAATT